VPCDTCMKASPASVSCVLILVGRDNHRRGCGKRTDEKDKVTRDGPSLQFQKRMLAELKR
jgi:hypothetical protein